MIGLWQAYAPATGATCEHPHFSPRTAGLCARRRILAALREGRREAWVPVEADDIPDPPNPSDPE